MLICKCLFWFCVISVRIIVMKLSVKKISVIVNLIGELGLCLLSFN